MRASLPRLALIIAMTAPCLASPSFITSPAHAQDGTPSKQQARTMFQDALALMAAGDYASALVKLQRVSSYKQTPQVTYYIAVCHEKLGKLVMALGEYRIALGDARQGDAPQVAEEAAKAIELLEPRIPSLTIDKGESARAASLTIDEKEVGEMAMGQPMLLDPGTHVIQAQAQGHEPFRQEIKLAEGQKASVTVEMQPLSGAAIPAPAPVTAPQPATPSPAPAPAPATPDDPSEPSSLRPTLGWVATGVGAAALITSGVFYMRRSSAIDDLEQQCGADGLSCPSGAKSMYDDGRRDTTIANVALGVGVVGVAAGMFLLLTGGDNDSTAATGRGVRIGPGPSTGWAGLDVSGAF